LVISIINEKETVNYHPFFSLIALFLSAQETNNVRQTELFNFGWKFHLGDLGNAEKVQFDDASWKAVDLPHDFQINQPWDKNAKGARGFKAMETGWYRKTFKANPEWKGKRVFIDFEGIMLTGDVWLNGEKIGGTDYGYLGFESDITKKLRFEEDNVMAVRASTGDDGDSRWYTGGGIFRDVHVFVKDTVSIARHGVFYYYPENYCSKCFGKCSGRSGRHSWEESKRRNYSEDSLA
jgi:beta-galactosidase